MTDDLNPRLLALGQPDLDDGHEGNPLLGFGIALMVGAAVWGFLIVRWWL